MFNLLLSFILASGCAVSLVVLSHMTGLEHYTSRVFPLIPLLYALIYQILERIKTGKAKSMPAEKVKPEALKREMRSDLKRLFRNITPQRIFSAIAISFFIKLVMESIISAIYIYYTHISVKGVYGNYIITIISRFLRGEHPWLSGIEGLYMLACLAMATSLGTGMWIGFTSKTSALLEGVISGMVVTIFTAMTNMLFLYQKIEEVTSRMAQTMGYNTPVGFMAVLSFQVMLYGFWSGIAQKIKQDRMMRRLAGRKKS